MPVRHFCFGKIRWICERTGLLLTHDEITFLCEHVLFASNADEFYRLYSEITKGMSKEEEREWLKRVLKKRKRTNQLIEEEERELELAYA